MVEFMVVDDYLIHQLICYLELNRNLRLTAIISGFTHQKHFLIINFDKTNDIINNIRSDLNIKIIYILYELKNEIKQIYPFYQLKDSIIVMKTISNLMGKFILFSNLILENVVIYVVCFNDDDMSIINKKINLIHFKKFFNNEYALNDDIKQIKKRICHHNSYINFKLFITRFQLNKLIYKNQNIVYLHKFLELYIVKICKNITDNTEIIINSYDIPYLEKFINPYLTVFKIIMVKYGMYNVHIKLSEEYKSKKSVVRNYLIKLIIALSKITTCLIDNHEVKIFGDESDSNH